jgi:signal transduction histidine kinase
MPTDDSRWFAVLCNLDFAIADILVTANMDVPLAVGERFAQFVLADDTGKFLDLTLEVKRRQWADGFEIGVAGKDRAVTVMSFGAMEYRDQVLLFAYTDFLGLYGELVRLNREMTDVLCEKLKASRADTIDYQPFTQINNEMVNMQRELARKKGESEKLNRELNVANATKNRIFSILGHDLRSPLASVIDGLRLASMRKSMYEEMVDDGYFEDMRHSLESAMLLLDNLLDWSKSQNGELAFYPEKFDLGETLREVMGLYQGVVRRKKIAFSESIPVLSPVYADSRMIATVLRNLVSNAVKFSNEGGRIGIAMDAEGKHARVTVSDQGQGMTEEKTARLFDLDRTGVEKGTAGETGTGLGLVLCKKFIEQNGGAITVSSAPGLGSRFTVTIPFTH